MVYAYQIFGNFFQNEKELKRISEEYRSRFEKFDGLISRYVFEKLAEEVASGLYICRDKETAEKIKAIVHEIRDKYDEDIGFTTEFIFKIVENENYE